MFSGGEKGVRRNTLGQSEGPAIRRALIWRRQAVSYSGEADRRALSDGGIALVGTIQTPAFPVHRMAGGNRTGNTCPPPQHCLAGLCKVPTSSEAPGAYQPAIAGWVATRGPWFASREVK